MFGAQSRLRFAAAFVASALASLVAASGSAQTINFRLNVSYANPYDPESGGTWELIAKTTSGPSNFGIADAVARISGIDQEEIELLAPHGIVNGQDIAGFQVLGDALYAASGTNPAFREFNIGQLPNFPLGLGEEANFFYGVGTIQNGSPKPGANSIGPTFSSLTAPKNIPWAPGDVFGSDPQWDTAVSLVSGTFAEGATPAFIQDNTTGGAVFTSVPAANNGWGAISQPATKTLDLLTNLLPQSADYNGDNIVDGVDYVLWRKTFGQTASPAGSGADGDHDGTVDQDDYDLWRSHFGNPSGSGSGGGLSTGTIPEPASGILLTIGALLISAGRRARFQA